MNDHSVALNAGNRRHKPNRKQIKHVTSRYEAILNWLIENPTAPMRDCAAYFGVSNSWLGVITNSDAFRARLLERQDEVFHTCVADLREKTHGAAHEALDLFMEKIHTIEDPMKLLKAVDTLFNQLGYGPKANIGSPQNYTQNNTTVVVGAEQLTNARAIMDQALEIRSEREPEIPGADAPLEPGSNLPPSLDKTDSETEVSSSSLPEAEGRGPLSPTKPDGD